PAGEYLRFVAPWLYLAAIAAPLTRLFDVLERQRADLLTSILMFVVQAAALVIGGRTGDVMLTLILLGITGFVARAAHIAVMLRISSVPWRNALQPYVRYAAYSLLPGIAIALTLSGSNNMLTVAVVVIGLAAYYAAIAVREGVLTVRE